MKISLTFPAPAARDAFLSSRQNLSISYPEKMDTTADFAEKRRSALGRKYNYDENRILLGMGSGVFIHAKTALRQWQMFPKPWTSIAPEQAPIRTGQKVGVFFRLLGCWWWNSSEIVYTINEPQQFGFAYGTLPGHVEQGEERFMVEMMANGEVWYSIKAFSRPAYWFVWLMSPYARSQQRRFVRNSMAQMKAMVTANTLQ